MHLVAADFADSLPNCLVRLAVMPVPHVKILDRLPANVVIEPFRVVASNTDLLADIDFRRCNDTTHPDWDGRPAVPLSAYVSSHEANRLAAVVLCVSNHPGISLMIKELTQTEKFINTFPFVLLQANDRDLVPLNHIMSNTLHPSRATDETAEFTQSLCCDDQTFRLCLPFHLIANNISMCVNNTVKQFVFVDAALIHEANWPRLPSRFVGYTWYGQFSNEILELATMVAFVRRKLQTKASSPAALFVNTVNMGITGVQFVFDVNMLARFLQRSNMLFSTEDWMTIDFIQYCLPKSSHPAAWSRLLPQTALYKPHHPNASPQLGANTTTDAIICHDRVVYIRCTEDVYAGTNAQRLRVVTGGTRRMKAYIHMAYYRSPAVGQCATTEQLDNFVNNASYSGHPLRICEGGDVFFFGATSRQPAALPMTTLLELYGDDQPLPSDVRADVPFSPVVYSLAQSLYAWYIRTIQTQQQLRSKLFRGANPSLLRKPRILGIHMRLGGLDKVSNGTDWLDAVNATMALYSTQLKANKIIGDDTPDSDVFDAVILCTNTESRSSPKVQSVLNMFSPKVMRFAGCTDNVETFSNGINMAVIQALLAMTDCFIGLDFSTFTHHIQLLRQNARMMQVNFMCDTVVAAQL
jgi:hypothetical protein